MASQLQNESFNYISGLNQISNAVTLQSLNQSLLLLGQISLCDTNLKKVFDMKWERNYKKSCSEKACLFTKEKVLKSSHSFDVTGFRQSPQQMSMVLNFHLQKCSQNDLPSKVPHCKQENHGPSNGIREKLKHVLGSSFFRSLSMVITVLSLSTVCPSVLLILPSLIS